MGVGDILNCNRRIFYGLAFSILALGLMSFSFQDAYAETKDWDGGGVNDNWSTGDNWDPNGVPAGVDTITIQNSCPSLINNDVTLTLTGSLTIHTGCDVQQSSGSFTNQGTVLVKSGGKLRMGGTGCLNDSTGTITTEGTAPTGGTLFFIGLNCANDGTITNNGQVTIGTGGKFSTINIYLLNEKV